MGVAHLLREYSLLSGPKTLVWQALPGLYLFKPFTSNGDVFRRVKHSRQTDRQREREREIDRQTDRQGERDGQTETERQRETDTDKQRQTDRQIQTDKQTETDKRETDRQIRGVIKKFVDCLYKITRGPWATSLT